MELAKLNNGVLMPQVSFGTYQIPPHRTRRCVEEALACGYRGIDTAQNYGNTTLTAIGDRHGKRAAQVALRFLVQRGDILAVKSTHRDRMLEDIDVFDFEFDADEVEAIEALDIGHGFTGWPSSGRIAEYTPSKAEQF